MSENCLFCRIVKGELPSRRVHEDDQVVAFHDVDPKAPTHILVVPRRHVASVSAFEEADAGLAGRLIMVAARIAESAGIAQGGYRLVLNTGQDAGQSVDHVHLHVLGGRSMSWPPG